MVYILIHTLLGLQRISSTTRTSTRQSKYSIKPADYSTKPLFLEDTDSETNNLLNKFFFYVFSFVVRWQCLKELSVLSIEDAATLSNSGYF